MDDHLSPAASIENDVTAENQTHSPQSRIGSAVDVAAVDVATTLPANNNAVHAADGVVNKGQPSVQTENVLHEDMSSVQIVAGRTVTSSMSRFRNSTSIYERQLFIQNFMRESSETLLQEGNISQMRLVDLCSASVATFLRVSQIITYTNMNNII